LECVDGPNNKQRILRGRRVRLHASKGLRRILMVEQKLCSQSAIGSWQHVAVESSDFLRSIPYASHGASLHEKRTASAVDHYSFGVAKFFDAESGRLLVGMAGWAIIMRSPQDNCLVRKIIAYEIIVLSKA